ncbi:hypothetical protein WAI453_013288 [Rhynchosporium graminicola]
MYLVVPGTYTLYLVNSLYPAYSIRVTMKVLDRVLLLSIYVSSSMEFCIT